MVKLSRKQLSSFLRDNESIRKFEQLQGSVESIDQSGGSEQIDWLAGSTPSTDADASSRIARLEELVHALVTRSSELNNSISTDYIDLPIDGPHVTQARRIQWNENDGTLDVGLLNDVVLQCGQELHFYAKNTSGVTIPDGSSVMMTGTVGSSGKLTIAKAVANGSVDPNMMMGVATQSIANNAFGYVTRYGLVRGIDTTGTPYGETWADGDVLYFNPSTPGGLTNVMPDAPNLRAKIAVVVNASSGGSGSIYVRMKISDRLKDLADVYMPTPWDLAYPAWNSSNSRWENSIAWVDIDFPIVIRTTGSNIPTQTTVQGNITAPSWGVNDFNVCEGQELIHAWQEGSQVRWHLHMLTKGLDATDRYVNWEVEWFWVNPNGQISATTTDTSEVLIPANTPTKTMILAPISTPTLTGGKIGGHVFARLRRIALVTPGRTGPTGNPWCWMLQLHIQCNTIGSRNHMTK